VALHLHLCDRNTPLCDAWREAFADVPLSTVHQQDFFSIEADVMVCGGNSLGLMESGLELAIALKLGRHIGARVREQIQRTHGGILPIGAALLLPTEDRRWPLLLYAPTMWLPMNIAETIQPYVAARAVFRVLCDLEAEQRRLWHVLLPGLGTGIGRVPPRACALQMRRAYDEIVRGHAARHSSLEEAELDYRSLVTGSDLPVPQRTGGVA
jgi:O-acetyl-ADP-ribose deacetylase (regulator of RNase III)